MSARQKFRLLTLGIGIAGWSLPFCTWPAWLRIPRDYFWVALPLVVVVGGFFAFLGLGLISELQKLHEKAVAEGPWKKWEVYGGILCVLPWLLAFAMQG